MSRSNRTFMELKYADVRIGRRTRQVLIAPLWNWNKEISEKFAALDGSNRTFMELKFHHKIRI